MPFQPLMIPAASAGTCQGKSSAWLDWNGSMLPIRGAAGRTAGLGKRIGQFAANSRQSGDRLRLLVSGHARVESGAA